MNLFVTPCCCPAVEEQCRGVQVVSEGIWWGCPVPWAPLDSPEASDGGGLPDATVDHFNLWATNATWQYSYLSAFGVSNTVIPARSYLTTAPGGPSKYQGRANTVTETVECTFVWDYGDGPQEYTASHTFTVEQDGNNGLVRRLTYSNSCGDSWEYYMNTISGEFTASGTRGADYLAWLASPSGDFVLDYSCPSGQGIVDLFTRLSAGGVGQLAGYGATHLPKVAMTGPFVGATAPYAIEWEYDITAGGPTNTGSYSIVFSDVIDNTISTVGPQLRVNQFPIAPGSTAEIWNAFPISPGSSTVQVLHGYTAVDTSAYLSLLSLNEVIAGDPMIGGNHILPFRTVWLDNGVNLATPATFYAGLAFGQDPTIPQPPDLVVAQRCWVYVLTQAFQVTTGQIAPYHQIAPPEAVPSETIVPNDCQFNFLPPGAHEFNTDSMVYDFGRMRIELRSFPVESGETGELVCTDIYTDESWLEAYNFACGS